MLTPPHGSRLNPIDLCSDDEELFPEPAKHWSQLFEQHLSGERTDDNVLNGASASGAITGHSTSNEIAKKFRINARSVFLTYPRCLLDKSVLMNFLASLKHEAKYIIVCHEKHKDGTPHLHAVIIFKSKIDITRNDYFDVNGYHPNIQTTKKMQASIQYCKKDGDYIEEGKNDDLHVNKMCACLPVYSEVRPLFCFPYPRV